ELKGQNLPMAVLKWIGIAVAAVIALRVLLRMTLLLRVILDDRRVTKEGVDGFAERSGFGFDTHLRGPAGKMACRLHLTWKHPQSGQEFKFDSPWFWAEPSTSDDPKLAKLPVRVVLRDPARFHRIDMSGAGVDLWRP